MDEMKAATAVAVVADTLDEEWRVLTEGTPREVAALLTRIRFRIAAAVGRGNADTLAAMFDKAKATHH